MSDPYADPKTWEEVEAAHPLERVRFVSRLPFHGKPVLAPLLPPLIEPPAISRSPRRWRASDGYEHECPACGATFYGTRCALVCPSCHALGRDRACGRCIRCGTRIAYHPHRRNRGPLFCEPCRDDRQLFAKKRFKRLRPNWDVGIVITPTFEESDVEPTLL